MKTYRIEVKGESIQFGFFLQAVNSHEANCAAKMMHPGFRVLDTVEVVNAPKTYKEVEA